MNIKKITTLIHLSNFIAIYFFIFAFLLIPLNASALTNDRDQPITLEADSADIDDKKGISIYTGNVVLTQGSMVIKSNKLTIFTDKEKELDKAIADGNKTQFATFKQRPEGKTSDFRAKAMSMTYYLKKDTIHLVKQAQVWQDGDTFSGNKIIYDTKNETVMASSKKNKDGQPSSSGRVKVTIQPRKTK